MLSKGIAM